MKRLLKCSICNELTNVIYLNGTGKYTCKDCLSNNIIEEGDRMKKVSDNVMELDLRDLAIKEVQQELETLVHCLKKLRNVNKQIILSTLEVCLEKLDWKKDKKDER